MDAHSTVINSFGPCSSGLYRRLQGVLCVNDQRRVPGFQFKARRPVPRTSPDPLCRKEAVVRARPHRILLLFLFLAIAGGQGQAAANSVDVSI